MTTVVNLTPHPVELRTATGTLRLPASHQPLRLGETVKDGPQLLIEGLPIPVRMVAQAREELELPPQTEDTIYLVAQLVARAVPEREDLFFPYDLVRDDDGNVVAAAALGQVLFSNARPSKED